MAFERQMHFHGVGRRNQKEGKKKKKRVCLVLSHKSAHVNIHTPIHITAAQKMVEAFL